MGVPEDASLADIRKVYRKLSLKYHPDKNPSSEATALFQELSVAYEILSNANKREAYDHYINHPEDYAYNYGMYYRHTFAPQSDLRLVMLGFILLITVLQYLTQRQRYRRALSYFRQVR